VKRLRATTHLADGANQLFDRWIEALSERGLDIEGAVGDDTALDADVIFACGLLTAMRTKQGQPLEVIAAPVFPGSSSAVYYSFIIANVAVGIDHLDGHELRLAVNEYDSWSGWHGFKEHLRLNDITPSTIGEHVLTGGHVSSIEAVLDGRADVASIDRSVWDARQNVDPRLAELEVIGVTRDWPAPPISIRTTLPDDLRLRLTEAILALPHVEGAALSDYSFMLAEAEEHPTWP